MAPAGPAEPAHLPVSVQREAAVSRVLFVAELHDHAVPQVVEHLRTRRAVTAAARGSAAHCVVFLRRQPHPRALQLLARERLHVRLLRPPLCLRRVLLRPQPPLLLPRRLHLRRRLLRPPPSFLARLLNQAALPRPFHRRVPRLLRLVRRRLRRRPRRHRRRRQRLVPWLARGAALGLLRRLHCPHPDVLLGGLLVGQRAHTPLRLGGPLLRGLRLHHRPLCSRAHGVYLGEPLRPRALRGALLLHLHRTVLERPLEVVLRPRAQIVCLLPLLLLLPLRLRLRT